MFEWLKNIEQQINKSSPQDDGGDTAVFNAAAQRYRDAVKPHEGLINFTTGVGGGSGEELIQQRANEAGQRAVQANAAARVGGGEMYTLQGQGIGGAYDVNLREPGKYNDPNFEANRAAIQARMGAIGGMPSYQMQGSTIDQAQQAQIRERQMQLAAALTRQANGQGPSVAGSQLRQSTDMNLQAAMAQAASARGGNLGAAQYQLGTARANIQQQAAMQLAQARIQEQMAARAQLGEVLGQGRGQDLGLANAQAQLNQGAAGANLNANIQQEQFRQQRLQELLGMGLSYDQANAQADLQSRQYSAQLFNSAAMGIVGANMQNQGQMTQIAGGGMAAGGALVNGIIGGMSRGGGGQAYQPGTTGLNNGALVSPNM